MAWSEGQTRGGALPIPIPVPVVVEAEPREHPVDGGPATAKIYVKNLHAQTSREDLQRLMAPWARGCEVQRPFVSNLTRGKRWGKCDVDASVAAALIEDFNWYSGVSRAEAAAEFARS